MPSAPEHHGGRRRFISQLASSTLLAAGAAAIPASARAMLGEEPATQPPNGDWDDSWTARVRAAKHRAVFDAPETKQGEVFIQVDRWLAGLRAALGVGDADALPVIVIRHSAIPMALDDVIWDKYEFAKKDSLDDPTTGTLARRNPFLRIGKDDKHAMIGAGTSIEALRARGAIFLGCNAALEGFAADAADRTKQKIEDVKAEFRAHVVPGVILQPNGVYATIRAQEAGCAFMRT